MRVLGNLVSFVLPVTAAGIVPALLVRPSQILVLARPDLALVGLALIGLASFAFGLFMLIWTVSLFISVGKGTLAPWNPTNRLVAEGPYAHSRNPMISGVLFILIGELCVFVSLGLAIWIAVFFLVNHAYFLLSEEPGLRKRFGPEYEDYTKNVPRWIPRVEAWKATKE